MHRLSWFMAAAAVGLGTLAAHAQMGGTGMRGGMGMMGGSVVRHQFVMRHGIDPSYASQANPLPLDQANAEAGRKLFEHDCAACHGPRGHGDGPAAKALKPPPANLASAVHTRMATDAYLYWTIAEGGAQLQTAMPAFKSMLKEDQIWKLIVYLRTLR